MLTAPSSDYALKTAWRLVAVVYGLAVVFVVPFSTIRLWASEERFIAVWIFLTLLWLAMFSGTSFAFAAVGWAAWSFRGRPVHLRYRAWIALSVALLTFALCAGYLLVMTGMIRLNRI
jgi:hypothetical protein